MMTTVLACLSVGVSLVVLGLVNVASSEIIDIDQGSAIEVRLKVKLSHDRYKYVYANTISGKVHLSHRTIGAFTGTRWRLINESNYFTIENLNSAKHRRHRFLQGQATDSSVLLTSGSSDTSRDTHWAIRGTDRDGYTITWLDSDSANPLSLHANLKNNRTYLAPGEFRWIIVSACSNRYLGPTRTTASGRTCQAWASQSPHNHTLGSTSEEFPDESIEHARNYCRDPDNSGYLWCYTNDPTQRWEKCNIDACDCATSMEQRSVKTKTISGRTCMGWTSQHPHKHSFFRDANFTDGSAAAAGNNCRDPSNDGFLWCYTTDPTVRWERCDEELCVAPSAKHKDNIWWNASNCGKTKYDAIDRLGGRVVGGHNARPHEVPWQVLVNMNGQLACGGVIISPYWVVTAAHCTFNGDFLLLSASNLQVIVGEHDRTVPNSKRQIHTVKSIHTHHRYSKSTNDYDIALLRLHRPIKFNDDVTAVCAPAGNDVTTYTNQSAQISGWGLLKYVPGGRQTSRVLQVAWVSITNPQLCASMYPGDITKQMVCAGKGDFSQVDTCQGDSGGPLAVRRSNGQFELVGLTSFGVGCASSLPGVYTNVPSLKSWISSVIREYQPCGS